MKLFDSHCHLQLSQFDEDRAEVFARMQESGVGAVVVGTDLATSRAAVELARQHSFLWAAVGLHPNDPEEQQAAYGANTWVHAFEDLAKDPKVVAIGECGLDYYRAGTTPDERAAQRTRFLNHIDIAHKVGKTLVIHCRDAHDDMVQILSDKKPTVPVVIHFFTGTGELADKYLALGCYLSFPGPITYTDMYDESIRVAPMERILIETDSPFAAPEPYRRKRNEPSYVECVAKKIATVKEVSVEEVARKTAENSQKAFGIA